VCGKSFATADLFPIAATRTAVRDLIQADRPETGGSDLICRPDLHRYRARYLEAILSADRGELTALEQEVIAGLERHVILTQDLEAELASNRTMGDRVADRVASFGGSWFFIGIFFSVLVVWIVLNSGWLLARPLDPFPFILLNLILSCLAAIQAPIIMMSQNRQSARDRLRAEHDYRINLKAELEIRQLHSKLDQLITHQWQRLLEIQRLQIEAMQELGEPPPN
jgi:uncharacterized membrane protein